MTNTSIFHLQSHASSLVIDCRARSPQIIYWGRALDRDCDFTLLERLNFRPEAPASAHNAPTLSLAPQHGPGFTGQTALRVHRQGKDWGSDTGIVRVDQPNASRLEIYCEDHNTQIHLIHRIEIDPISGVVTASSELINCGSSDLSLDWCAALTFPVAAKYSQLLAFSGRWALEFQQQVIERFSGCYLRENRKGRTSHDSFPGLIVKTDSGNEQQGETLGFHLGWSGNHRLCLETLSNNSGLFHAGELLLPGEIQLAPGEHYRSPALYAVYSDRGLNGVRQSFHSFVRRCILPQPVASKPRPIHLNTWEALYFDHSPQALENLAQQAAALGVERFVLDDGWFKGRRSDRSGLGDWFVDSEVYPQGLHALIKRVRELNMEFGLWLEPEMVNPDSDLYRKHPDWVLHIPTSDTVLARHQLVLDLSRPEVGEYLHQRIAALLDEYEIAYLKWDMNRDLHQPGDSEGRASVHRQTYALYALIDRIRHDYPQVEIESCASGGGRADYGILTRCHRIWTSDSNDAIDRLGIQKGCSLFFPPEIMGAHIGPRHCHITGRTLPASTRAAVALFGHLGLELNLAQTTAEELAVIQEAIALHKQHRPLLHHGITYYLRGYDKAEAFAVLREDRREGLYAYVQIDSGAPVYPGRFYFSGLLRGQDYRVECLWGSSEHQQQFATLKQQPFPSELLMENGIELPLLQPQSALIFYVRAIADC